MKKLLFFVIIICLWQVGVTQPRSNKLIVNTDQGKIKISKHIYGHFSEHLGRCIYGGIWVGEDSPIPNTNGVRNDIIEALKNIQVPNLRWPGGCFADEYYWMDGIGPRESRPKMINTHWGGIVEDNSFGTHEFLNFCEEIGAEPYLSMNVGSGTVEELTKWVEYVNSDGDSPMANLRRQNGREKPWNVKFIGIGNESWGCGGDMRPEYYADLYRRYAIYARNYGEHRIYKVASGASDYDYNWTKVLMERIGNRMHGISLHYYTVKTWTGSKGSATQFTEDEYSFVINKSLGVEPVIQRHISIMDQYDPDKKIGLLLDEWGTWFDVEPGTNPGFLFQQNTMRDAFVAGLSLNIFHKYAERLHMANLAQIVNVLQAVILTEDEKMVLTPTYHVFDLYKVHQDAMFIPTDLITEDYEYNGRKIPALNVSASRSDDGYINISIVNVHPTKSIPLDIDLRGANVKNVTGRILTSDKLNDHNTFDNPDKVKIANYTKAQLKNNNLKAEIPSKSVVVLRVR